MHLVSPGDLPWSTEVLDLLDFSEPGVSSVYLRTNLSDFEVMYCRIEVLG